MSANQKHPRNCACPSCLAQLDPIARDAFARWQYRLQRHSMDEALYNRARRYASLQTSLLGVDLHDPKFVAVLSKARIFVDVIEATRRDRIAFAMAREMCRR